MKNIFLVIVLAIGFSACSSDANYQLAMGGEKSPYVIDVETGEVFRLRDLREGHWYSLGIPHENIRMPKTDILYNKLIEKELTTKTEDEFYSEIDKEEYRDILFNLVSREGLYTKSRDQFEDEYFYMKP
ncbi:MAG: hypothetical protein HOM38_09110 [Euryarchaeota archaeon]|jgi:hypothetical protein|nr:hypothetical protein [Euryarchaeota archaeon]